MSRLAIFFVFSILSTAAAAPSNAGIEEIVVSIATDKSAYQLGEPVQLVVNKCNPTEEAITIGHGCAGCHDELLIVDSSGSIVFDCPVGGGILVPVDITWQPGECRSDDFTWYQVMAPTCMDSETVAPGQYSLSYRWRFGDSEVVTEAVPITIGLAPAVPSTSAFGAALLVLALGLAGARALGRAARARTGLR